MKSIDIFSHSYPSFTKPGTGIFIKNEAELLSDTFDIRLIIPQVFGKSIIDPLNQHSDFIPSDVPVHSFNYLSVPKRKLPGLTYYSINHFARTIISSTKADLFHLHFLFPSALLLPNLKSSGRPVIITIHGGDWFTNLGTSVYSYIEKALLKADIILVVGKSLERSILKHLPEVTSKIKVIHHGIDTKFFHLPSKNQKYIAKKKLNWDSGQLNILSVANLYPEKGLDLLINACRKLRNQFDFKLHIVSGSGDYKYETTLKTLIADADLTNFITLYPAVSPDILVEYYHAADCFVLPSRNEAFGLALAEALSCGLPSLSTSSGGPEEIITEKTGLLVSPGSIDSLYKGLTELLSNLHTFDPEVLHKYIEMNFSLNSKKEKLLSIYQTIL